MKKPEITPGPWRLNPGSLGDNKSNYFFISAKDTTSKNSIVKVVSWKYGKHPIKECTDRWKADAQAISAVPEMIDALIEAKNKLEHVQQFSGYGTRMAVTISQIDAVLEKAGAEL